LQRHRRPPYIYTSEEILTLMHRARGAIRQRLVAATYETLIGLLAATGMRISEAINLDDGDIDWDQGVLLVRESKFNRSRYLPLHHTTLDALERYQRDRDQFCADPRDPSFVISLRRKRLEDGAAHATFRRLCDATGIGAGAPFPPRMHDLRHTKAVRTLLSWYREGADVQARLPGLSTYLGHLNPLIPTTTSRLRRSYSHTPPECSKPARRPSHDTDRADNPGVLHRPAGPSSCRPARAPSPATATACACSSVSRTTGPERPRLRCTGTTSTSRLSPPSSNT
jgi:integrase